MVDFRGFTTGLVVGLLLGCTFFGLAPMVMDDNVQVDPGSDSDVLQPVGAEPDLSQLDLVLEPTFTENIGQWNENPALFYSIGDRASIALGPDWVSYIVRVGADGGNDLSHVYRVTFEGANDVLPVGVEPVGSISSHFRGGEHGLVNHVARKFREIRYHNIYEDIELRFYFKDNLLKYDYLLGPGGDPQMIQQVFSGVNGMSVCPSSGDLLVETPVGIHRETTPFAYQLGPTGPVEVDCTFAVHSPEVVGYLLGEYDDTRTLIIDPTLVFSTLFGGSNYDRVSDGAVDEHGNIYVVGTTNSDDLPTTPGSYSHEGGEIDIFVAKLRPDGTELLYCARIGGSDHDAPNSIDIGPDGCAYVVGSTSSPDFPVSIYDFDLNGSTDAFILKLSTDGRTLEFSTYFGGSESDQATAVQVDDDGLAYLVGNTNSSDIPLVWYSALDRSLNGKMDGFLAVFRGKSGILEYCTYFGGENEDVPVAMWVDIADNVYIVGRTLSEEFPTTRDAYDTEFSNRYDDRRYYDGFVMRLAGSGSHLSFSTYLGGRGSDIPTDLFVDDQGYVYVTGQTSSDDFPCTFDALDVQWGESYDCFLTKMNPTGSTLMYSTFLGGDSIENDCLIEMDGLGRLIIVGDTMSEDFPVTENLTADPSNSRSLVFATILNLTGTQLEYSTLVGGRGYDVPKDIAIGEHGDIIIMGYSTLDKFPTTEGAYCETMGQSGTVAFACKLQLPKDPPVDRVPPFAKAGPDQTIPVRGYASLNAKGTFDDVELKSLRWVFDYKGGEVFIDMGTRFTTVFNFDTPGVYELSMYAMDTSGNIGFDTMQVTVLDIEPPTARFKPPSVVEPNDTIELHGGGSKDDFGIVKWVWSIKIDAMEYILEGETVTHNFTKPGTYLVNLTVSDVSGNQDSLEIEVPVFDYTNPLADAGRDQVVKWNETVFLDGSGSRDNVAIVNWTWTVTLYDGNTTVLYGVAPNVTLNISGTYRIILDVRDASGRTGRDSVLIDVMEEEKPDEPETESSPLISISNLQILILVIVLIAFVFVILLNAYGGGGEIRI